jgi:hypothetical protein
MKTINATEGCSTSTQGRFEVQIAARFTSAHQFILQEFGFGAVGVDPGRHEIMALVAQDAHYFGREQIIKHLDHGLEIGLVVFRHGTLFMWLRARSLIFFWSAMNSLIVDSPIKQRYRQLDLRRNRRAPA